MLLTTIIVASVMSCCAPEGVKPKFKNGEIVIIEKEKFVVQYSLWEGNESDGTFVYEVQSLKEGNELRINENSIFKYIKEENQTQETDATSDLDTTTSDTISY